RICGPRLHQGRRNARALHWHAGKAVAGCGLPEPLLAGNVQPAGRTRRAGAYGRHPCGRLGGNGFPSRHRDLASTPLGSAAENGGARAKARHRERVTRRHCNHRTRRAAIMPKPGAAPSIAAAFTSRMNSSPLIAPCERNGAITTASAMTAPATTSDTARTIVALPLLMALRSVENRKMPARSENSAPAPSENSRIIAIISFLHELTGIRRA